MTLYVVRHAHAGNKAEWAQDDRLRPLSERGCIESFGVADVLADAEVERLISSPLTRCLQTLEPAAGRLNRNVEVDHRLSPDGVPADLAALLKESSSGRVALCTHGEIIPYLLEPLVEAGMEIDHELTWPKGSIWEIRGLGTKNVSGRFHNRVEPND